MFFNVVCVFVKVSSSSSILFSNLKINTHHIKLQLVTSLTSVQPSTENKSEIYMTPRISQLLQTAKEESERLNDEFVSVEHIFIAVVRETQGAT